MHKAAVYVYSMTFPRPFLLFNKIPFQASENHFANFMTFHDPSEPSFKFKKLVFKLLIKPDNQDNKNNYMYVLRKIRQVWSCLIILKILCVIVS